MKYGLFIMRPDNTFDFYSRLSELHEREEIKVSYQYFQRQLKEHGSYEMDNGAKIYRKPILRGI